jgi:hypothetical protein
VISRAQVAEEMCRRRGDEAGVYAVPWTRTTAAG